MSARVGRCQKFAFSPIVSFTSEGVMAGRVEREMSSFSLGRAARVVATGGGFALFWTGGAGLSWLVLPALRRHGGQAGLERQQGQALLRHGFSIFHSYLRLLRLIEIELPSERRSLPDGPFVMVANHPSLVDVTALLAFCPRLACVVKGGIYQGKLVRPLLELCGHIDGGGDGPLSAATVAVDALARLADGQPVLVFPEGTRSPAWGLRSFQAGAFEVARRAQVPLVPIFLTCDPPILTKEQPWHEMPREPARLRLSWLAPNEPFMVPRGDSRALARQFRQRYHERYEQWLRERDASGKVLSETGRDEQRSFRDTGERAGR
jgi:1-acyl-sn-glycerol-3-phosphate acyltransferase